MYALEFHGRKSCGLTINVSEINEDIISSFGWSIASQYSPDDHHLHHWTLSFPPLYLSLSELDWLVICVCGSGLDLVTGKECLVNDQNFNYNDPSCTRDSDTGHTHARKAIYQRIERWSYLTPFSLKYSSGLAWLSLTPCNKTF